MLTLTTRLGSSISFITVVVKNKNLTACASVNGKSGLLRKFGININILAISFIFSNKHSICIRQHVTEKLAIEALEWAFGTA